MTGKERTLRMLIEKWLPAVGMTGGGRHTLRFVRARYANARCLHVSASGLSRAVEIVFFQHRDGVWRIFPQDVTRLSMWVDRTTDGSHMHELWE